MSMQSGETEQPGVSLLSDRARKTNKASSLSAGGRRPGFLSPGYLRLATEAAALEREQVWVSAAEAWADAECLASGLNVHWCGCRAAWCLHQARKAEVGATGQPAAARSRG